MANQTFVNTQTREKEIKSLYFNITAAKTAATATLATTTPIVLTKAATGTLAGNTFTFTLQVVAAAANPAATVLAVFTGTAAAIVCTITPNDGTNNAATPVNLTTAELRELITTGAVVGKTVTLTDVGALRNDQTATGGGAEVLADGGEGDGKVATFSGAVDFTVNNAVGFSLFEEVATGTIRARLDDKWVALRGVNFTVIDSTVRDFTTQIKAYDMNPSGANAYIDIYCLTAGAATNLTAGAKLMGTINLKNTTISI